MIPEQFKFIEAIAKLVVSLAVLGCVIYVVKSIADNPGKDDK